MHMAYASDQSTSSPIHKLKFGFYPREGRYAVLVVLVLVVLVLVLVLVLVVLVLLKKTENRDFRPLIIRRPKTLAT